MYVRDRLVIEGNESNALPSFHTTMASEAPCFLQAWWPASGAATEDAHKAGPGTL